MSISIGNKNKNENEFNEIELSIINSCIEATDQEESLQNLILKTPFKKKTPQTSSKFKNLLQQFLEKIILTANECNIEDITNNIEKILLKIIMKETEFIDNQNYDKVYY